MSLAAIDISVIFSLYQKFAELSVTHTHISVSKMAATKRHLLDVLALSVYGSSYCKTQFNNVLTCGAELIKSLRLFQLFTLSERKNHESMNTTVQVSLLFCLFSYLFI